MYRKYRPRSFSDAIGQEAITKTLEEAIRSGRISHAYLFAGPKGVGKTSIARILAHAVNNLKYEEADNHLDIIEIDAASNRRIDEIRDLREKVHITPASAKYKVYIIDEVHMLTKEAFNALLKTLEEPPAHVIFILATTEPHKLPETIISRTQRFNFKPITISDTKKRLSKISNEEKIDIDDEALTLLTESSEGSLRDIISALDQLSSSDKKITVNDVRGLLGVPSTKAIAELAAAAADGNAERVLNVLAKFKDKGSSPVSVAKLLSLMLRRQLLDREVAGNWVIEVLKQLLDITSSNQPFELLEIILLDAAINNQHRQVADPKQEIKIRDQAPNGPEKNNLNNMRKIEKKTNATVHPIKKIMDLADWQIIIEKTRVQAPSLYTALRLAKPVITDEKLELIFPFSLHQKKVKEARHLNIVHTMVEEVTGSNFKIVCTVDKSLAKDKGNSEYKEYKLSDPNDLQVISNIFGSAELLES